jgi:hypothetical protein
MEPQAGKALELHGMQEIRSVSSGMPLLVVTVLSTVFKGARSAPSLGRPLPCLAPHEGASTLSRRQMPSVSGPGRIGKPWAPGAACRSLALKGHGGVGAQLVPVTDRTGSAATTWPRCASCKTWPSLRRSIMKPRKIVV